MVISIGMDLVEIKKIQDFIAHKSTESLLRVFTKSECEYAQRSQNMLERFAVRFAVKEAFFKAAGFGNFSEIEVCHDENKKPYVTLHGSTKSQWDNLYPNCVILTTLTHTQHYASAVVLIQQK